MGIHADLDLIEIGQRVMEAIYWENLKPGTMVTYDEVCIRGYRAQREKRIRKRNKW